MVWASWHPDVAVQPQQKRIVAQIQNFHDTRSLAAPAVTFDITLVTAERVFGDLHEYSFNTDIAMVVLHISGTTVLAGRSNVAVQAAVGNLAQRRAWL